MSRLMRIYIVCKTIVLIYKAESVNCIFFLQVFTSPDFTLALGNNGTTIKKGLIRRRDYIIQCCEVVLCLKQMVFDWDTRHGNTVEYVNGSNIFGAIDFFF